MLSCRIYSSVITIFRPKHCRQKKTHGIKYTYVDDFSFHTSIYSFPAGQKRNVDTDNT